MSFLFCFVSSKPFLYLIGALCVSGIFQLVNLAFKVKGGMSS